MENRIAGPIIVQDAIYSDVSVESGILGVS